MNLVCFFLLTFALTWTTWLASARWAGPDNSGVFSVGGPVFLLGVFAPAIVSLALTARAETYVVALSVAMAWLYWKSGGSLLLVMLMHASVNNTGGIVPAAVPGASDAFAFSPSLVGWISVSLGWIVAIPMLIQMRRADWSP